jgi:hypothetical protein
MIIQWITAMKQQRSRVTILLIIGAVGIAIIIIPVFFSFLERYVARMPLPTYPRASNVVTRYENNVRITTFQTPDRPEEVLQFYETELQKKGWQVRRSGEPAMTITYTYIIEETASYGESFYTTVVVSSMNGLTTIEVEESHGPVFIDRFPGLTP